VSVTDVSVNVSVAVWPEATLTSAGVAGLVANDTPAGATKDTL
jgi:hypothetical protein